jgi:hypothetical protein
MGGDSVGTLPSTVGGNAVVIGQSTDALDTGYGVQHRCANYFITISERGLNLSVLSASGDGYVLLVPLAKGQVRAEFHGDVSLVLDEEMLELFGAQMGVVSEDPSPLTVGVEMDSLEARPVRMVGGAANVIPVMALMDASAFGVENLVLRCFQAPLLPSEIQFTRGAGVLVVNQSAFLAN